MKKKILICSMVASIAILSFAAVAQQDEKAIRERKHVAEAKKDLREAKIDSAADYQKFVTDANLNINENKKIIARLRTKEIKNNKSEQKSYNKKVLALETKNNELQRRIEDSQHTKTNLWERFKLNFTRDFEKLGEDIKRI